VFPELNLGILELIEDLFNKQCMEALRRVSKPEQLYICDWFQKRGMGGRRRDEGVRTGIAAAPH